MNMYIVMYMNIYITPTNEEYLKSLKDTGDSMSGLVNHLLDAHRINIPPIELAYNPLSKTVAGKPVAEVLITEPTYSGFDTSYRQTPEFKEFLVKYGTPGTKPPHPEFGYPCCHKDAPCKHWVWSDGVYKNTLTGKTRDE